MDKKFRLNADFARKTFNFLKKALSSGEKQESFQPRGPKEFIDGDWAYFCEWNCDISKFKGNEKIIYKGGIVFTHTFFGGIILNK